MIPALAPYLRGALAEAASGLAPHTDDRPASPGTVLGDPVALRRLIEAYGRANHTSPDRIATASVWSKWHFSRVALPALFVTLLTGFRLDLRLDRIAIILTGDDRTDAVKLPDPAPEITDMSARPFLVEAILNDHVAPFVAASAQASRVSNRVMWSNLANGFESGVERLGHALGGEHAAVRAAREIIAASELSGFGINPLYDAVHYEPGPDGTTLRKRRVCCLRYRNVGVSLCKSCPIDTIPARFRASEIPA